MISPTAVREEDRRRTDEAMSIDNLHRFIDLNFGRWTDSFHQFDGDGNVLHKIDTRLSVSSYGEDELISLIQSLYKATAVHHLDRWKRRSLNGCLKLPSWRPYVVCENCLYSQTMDRRARAFHIMDPRGVLEDRGEQVLVHPVLDNFKDDEERIIPFLGTWKGHSVTKRSGVYGATIAEADTTSVREMDDKDQLVQVFCSTSGMRDVTTNQQLGYI